MKIYESLLNDVVIIIPDVYHDNRGFFFESFNERLLESHDLPTHFVQDNQSFSVKGVLRGLHFQKGRYAQGKLVRVIQGRVLDVALDLRPESSTFGQYELFDLDGTNGKMVYIPPGFAHGFVALEDSIFHYKCTTAYNKESEDGIHWNDQDLRIPWGVTNPIVSEKDQALPVFKEIVNQNMLLV